MRNIILIKCVFIILFFVSNATFANAKITCSPIKVESQNKNIILPGIEQRHTTKIYFMKNISDKSLWVDHPVEKRSVSAGWSSYFQPGQWSALLINRKNFAISCALIQPGKVSYQDCGKVISVCVPQKVAFEAKRKGSYWLVENKSWDDLLKLLEKKGLKMAP